MAFCQNMHELQIFNQHNKKKYNIRKQPVPTYECFTPLIARYITWYINNYVSSKANNLQPPAQAMHFSQKI